MPDRLADLRRQRALVQEQLTWLDREIATAAGLDSGHEPKATAKPLEVARLPTGPIPAATSSSAEADDIVARYRVAPDTVKSDVRKGCLIYFAVALALLAIGVAVLYFSLRRQ